MTDVSTITARIIAIMDDASGVDLADDQYPAAFSAANLPFCFVEEGQATFESIDTDTVECVQEWLLLLYVQAFDDEIQSEEDAAYQAVRPYLTSIPTYFWQRTRLQRSDQGLTDVKQAQMGAHQGIQSADRDGVTYMGAAFTLTVTYDMRIDQV
jgi:hypothetical protein